MIQNTKSCVEMCFNGVTQDQITTEGGENKGQDSFIMKKLDLLSSGPKTLSYEQKDDSKMTDGRLQ